MINKIITLMLLTNIILIAGTRAQNIAINTTGSAANAAAILDLTNTANLGLLIPSITTATLPTTIATGSQGLLFYNTTTSLFNVNSSTSTTPLFAPVSNVAMGNVLSYTSGSNITSTIGGVSSTLDLAGATTGSVVWSVVGNAIATAVPVPGTYGISVATGNFLGTTNTNDLVFAAKGYERMRIMNGTGNVGIGTVAPNSTLELSGSFGSSINSYSSTTSNIVTVGSATVYYITSAAISTSVILPTVAACNCNNRRYILVNTTGSSIYLYTTAALSTPSYILKLYNGTNSNYLAANMAYEIIADPVNGWLQIR